MKKDISEKTPKTLTWHAVEYVPVKRWYWWVGLVLIGGWFSLFFFYRQEWVIGTVAVVAVITYFITYLSPARGAEFTLEDDTLTVNGQTQTLDVFRCFITDTREPGKDGNSGYSYILLPRASFSLPFYLPLPEKASDRTHIARLLEQSHVPHSTTDGYIKRLQIIRKLTQLLHL